MSVLLDVLAKGVVEALVHDQGADPAEAEAAVRAVRRDSETADDPLSVYRAARRLLQQQMRPSDVRALHESKPPESIKREPPKRRGTARDTPIAKKRT